MQNQSVEFESRGVSLPVFLFGFLSGTVLAILFVLAINFVTEPGLSAVVTFDRLFVVKIALSAAAVVITLFAVAMTIRSQIRQRILGREIDELFKKTNVFANDRSDRRQT